MGTPFDSLLKHIQDTGYHNHRDKSHSDLLTKQIVADLIISCEAIAKDLKNGTLHEWCNTDGPDGRNTDLLLGAANVDDSPDLNQVRILVEHKSVITAHRNRNARQQDIEREMLATYSKNPRTIVVATLIVGVCNKVLNVPDCVKKDPRYTYDRFTMEILPKLSTGDQWLWNEFRNCVSKNTADDPLNTIKLFQELPVRAVSDTHETALDFLLFVPVAIDNVNPPRVVQFNQFDPIVDYEKMIKHICLAYTIRWHGRG